MLKVVFHSLTSGIAAYIFFFFLNLDAVHCKFLDMWKEVIRSYDSCDSGSSE